MMTTDIDRLRDKQAMLDRASKIYSKLLPLARQGLPFPLDLAQEYQKLVSGRQWTDLDQLRRRRESQQQVRLAVRYAMDVNTASAQGTRILLALLVCKAYDLGLDPELIGSFNPPRAVGPETKEPSNEPSVDSAEGADRSQGQPAQRILDSTGY